MLPPPRHPAERKRTHRRTEIHRIGDGHFSVLGHPARPPLGILGDDTSPGYRSPGIRIEEIQVGGDEVFADALVVVDPGQQIGPGLRQTAVAGMGNAGLGLEDHAQIDPRMLRGERRETFLGIVSRSVVHNNALPRCRVGALPHDGAQGDQQLFGTVVRRDDKRKTNHTAKVRKISAKPRLRPDS